MSYHGNRLRCSLRYRSASAGQEKTHKTQNTFLLYPPHHFFMNVNTKPNNRKRLNPHHRTEGAPPGTKLSALAIHNHQAATALRTHTSGVGFDHDLGYNAMRLERPCQTSKLKSSLLRPYYPVVKRASPSTLSGASPSHAISPLPSTDRHSYATP